MKQVIETQVITSSQPFGSPAGKTYLAPRIVSAMPKHKIYVEPFVGGGAVFYRKYPSEVEVLNDKDKEIIFANRFLRDMTVEQFKKLKKMRWDSDREYFYQLKLSKPKSDITHFHKFFYLKRKSYASGMQHYSPLDNQKVIDFDRLWRTHERLNKVKLQSGDYMKMIEKYDTPDTFFYLDPPYPKRAFVGGRQSFKDIFTDDDLANLIDRLKRIKGKFILSLGTESIPLIPKSWHIRRVKVRRVLPPAEKEMNRAYQFEILISKQPIGELAQRRERSKKYIPKYKKYYRIPECPAHYPVLSRVR